MNVKVVQPIHKEMKMKNVYVTLVIKNGIMIDVYKIVMLIRIILQWIILHGKIQMDKPAHQQMHKKQQMRLFKLDLQANKVIRITQYKPIMITIAEMS